MKIKVTYVQLILEYSKNITITVIITIKYINFRIDCNLTIRHFS